MDAEALGKLAASHSLKEDRVAVYAVDGSVWPRCDAEATPERGFYYHPSRHSAGQPIVAFFRPTSSSHNSASSAAASWVALMDLRRLRPTENQNEVATEQVKLLLMLKRFSQPKKSAAA